MRLALLALAVLIYSMGVVRAADQAAPDPLLEQATSLAGFAMFLDSGAPGLVLVVVRDGATIVQGFGETARGSSHTPDGDSLLRLNSITKVFTTEVLVSLAAQGRLRLTDPLQRYAGTATVPTLDGRGITLLDLATHTAALPREMGEEPHGMAPRTWPTRAERWAWLPAYKLPWQPGTVAAYSNIGFDLLADAVETAGGEPYPSLLRSRVTAKLGMDDTLFTPSPAQCARLMTGVGLGGAGGGAGGPGPCVDTTATDGSGGLYSTANDMAKWLRHNLADPSGTLALSHATYRLRQSLVAAIGFDDSGPMAGLGLGWVSMAPQGIRPAIIAKSGGGVGFMTYLAFAPGRGVGVFVGVNRLDVGMFHGMTEAANGLISSLVTK